MRSHVVRTMGAAMILFLHRQGARNGLIQFVRSLRNRRCVGGVTRRCARSWQITLKVPGRAPTEASEFALRARCQDPEALEKAARNGAAGSSEANPEDMGVMGAHELAGAGAFTSIEARVTIRSVGSSQRFARRSCVAMLLASA